MRNLLRSIFVVNAMMLVVTALLGASQASAAGSGCLPGVLKQRLSDIRAKFGPVSIISSHRPGARVAGSGQRSYHASCRAVDFHVRGNYRAVVAWLKANHGGGIGTYSCGMRHIHIDNGPRIRFHKCVAKNGARIRSTRYSRRRGKNRTVASTSKRNRARYAAKPKATWVSTY